MADVSGRLRRPSDLSEDGYAAAEGPDLAVLFTSLASVESVVGVFADLEQSEHEDTSRL